MRREERQQHARENTRRAILDAALELFIADGYAQVSIRNIAAKVEYSPGAIYSYFPSKDEIFFALAEEGFREIGERQFAGSPSDDPLDDVRAVGVASLRVQQGPAAVLRAGVPRSPRATRGPGVRALLVHLRDAQSRAGAGAALHRRTASSRRRRMPRSRCACSSPQSSASPRCVCRTACTPDVDADALVRDAIETTMAGIRAGAPHTRADDVPDLRPSPSRPRGRSSASCCVVGACHRPHVRRLRHREGRVARQRPPLRRRSACPSLPRPSSRSRASSKSPARSPRRKKRKWRPRSRAA